MKRWYYEANAKDRDDRWFIFKSKSFWNPYGYIGSWIIKFLVKRTEGLEIQSFYKRMPLYHNQIVRKL